MSETKRMRQLQKALVQGHEALMAAAKTVAALESQCKTQVQQLHESRSHAFSMQLAYNELVLWCSDTPRDFSAQLQSRVLERAIAMFDAYNEAGPNPWKTWDGKDVPRWEALNDQVRGKWLAAAGAAFDLPAFEDHLRPLLKAHGFEVITQEEAKRRFETAQAARAAAGATPGVRVELVKDGQKVRSDDFLADGLHRDLPRFDSEAAAMAADPKLTAHLKAILSEPAPPEQTNHHHLPTCATLADPPAATCNCGLEGPRPCGCRMPGPDDGVRGCACEGSCSECHPEEPK